MNFSKEQFSGFDGRGWQDLAILNITLILNNYNMPYGVSLRNTNVNLKLFLDKDMLSAYTMA